MNLKEKLIKKFVEPFATLSYGQEGEDIILARFLGNQGTGFFVDVGAHHPKRFSNTYYFYKRGWRGVNIDATPGSMQAFKSARPEDVNIEVPISQVSTVLTFYGFKEPALNTLSPEIANERVTSGHQIIVEKKLTTQPLSEVLKPYLPTKKTISFLNIDVEGLDLQVLQSNNWDTFKPNFILIEYDQFNYQDFSSTEVFQFLTTRNYEFIAKTMYTIFFRLKD